MDWVPKKIFFTKGVGIAKSEQISYIRALTDAKLAKYNLIQVSSIVPPNCKKITPKEGLQNLQPGQTLYVVLARISSNIPNQQIAASIGVAKPYHPKIHGYLAEYENINQSSEEVAKFSEDMAVDMLKTTFNYKELKNQMPDKTENEMFEKTNITSYSRVSENGFFNTAVAIAALIF